MSIIAREIWRVAATAKRTPSRQVEESGQQAVAQEACSAAGGLAGDVGNVGTIDADILQFPVGIGRQFVQNFPVTATLFQVAGNEGELHFWNSFSLFSSIRRKTERRFHDALDVSSPRRPLDRLLRRTSQGGRSSDM